MLATDASRTVDLDGYTHYLELGGPDGVPPLVCVHGLGGSHVNWTAVGPTLAEHQHVYVPDLAGHGLTFPDHRRTDVDSNQRLLDRFLREVSGTPVVLMGNSMGGLITILQASRHPETVCAVVLIAPAIPGPVHRLDPTVGRNFASYALPGIGNAILARRRQRLTPAQQVQEVLDLCCVDTSRVPRELFDRQVAVAARRRTARGIDAAFLDSARSVMLHLVRRREQLFAAMRSIDVPVLLLQGDRDRLVSVKSVRMAAASNPHWDLRIAEGVGHVPQMEAPDWTIEQYRGWIDAAGLLRG
jgi:pimeloyl-ACP methyl ester carboxylesterase